MNYLLTLLVEVQIVLLVAIMWGQVKTVRKIMSAISDFQARQNIANDRFDVALGDLAEDVKTLTDAVANGTPSPADAAILEAQAVRSETNATAIEALAAQTANPVVVPPPVV